jgi:hypothetical protein
MTDEQRFAPDPVASQNDLKTSVVRAMRAPLRIRAATP